MKALCEHAAIENSFNGSIFIGPVNVAGLASRLHEGFEQCGVKSRTVLAWEDSFQYVKKSSGYLGAWQWIGKQRQLTPSNQLFKKAIFVLLHQLMGFGLLPWALVKFDAFIFLFAQTITNTSLELKLLKLCKKRLIFVYAGSDVRPPYMDGGLFPDGQPLPSNSALKKLTQRKKNIVQVQEKFADYVVNSPFCAQFQEKEFVNWFAMGVPFATANNKQTDQQENSYNKDTVRILHSPSNPAVKGTPRILNILNELKAKGLKFHLVLLQHMSNDQVIQEIQQCDFVIDQLYSDTPMAVFATEAAQFGKPAVVGSYVSTADSSLFSSHGCPPSLFVAPEEMKGAIEAMILSKEKREQLGADASKFVKNQWNSVEVAKRYLSLLGGDCDPEWLVKPGTVNYALGCGLPKERSAKLVFSMLNEFDEKALCLDDKPGLLHSVKNNAEAHCGDANA